MASAEKIKFLAGLSVRFPSLRKSESSLSLFEIPESSMRIYVRYSKLHPRNRTFFGLRKSDLQWLESHRAIIAFIWDGQPAPLLVPFGAFEDVFASVSPAQDGQFKTQIILDSNSTELYIANAGRFNVDGYLGWNELNLPADQNTRIQANTLSHSQIQTLFSAIGAKKGEVDPEIRASGGGF